MEVVSSICTAKGDVVHLLGLTSTFFLMLTSRNPSRVWNSASAVLLSPLPCSRVVSDSHRGCSCPPDLPWVPCFHFHPAPWDCSCSHLHHFSSGQATDEGLEASSKNLGSPLLAQRRAFER